MQCRTDFVLSTLTGKILFPDTIPNTSNLYLLIPILNFLNGKKINFQLETLFQQYLDARLTAAKQIVLQFPKLEKLAALAGTGRIPNPQQWLADIKKQFNLGETMELKAPEPGSETIH